VGDLTVTSEPTNEMITIDSASGQDYFTARSFVVSVGAHTVSVASCREVVRVGAYQKATMNCPRR
jgi:glucose dehydrogenase